MAEHLIFFLIRKPDFLKTHDPAGQNDLQTE